MQAVDAGPRDIRAMIVPLFSTDCCGGMGLRVNPYRSHFIPSTHRNRFQESPPGDDLKPPGNREISNETELNP
jgi:hypothetical protein